MVKQYPVCARDFTWHMEQPTPTKLLDYPWQTIGTDPFHFKGNIYLVAVDYFPTYPEFRKFTSHSITVALKYMM